MKYEVLTEPRKIDRKEWSDFVLNHPGGNIFQTPDMFDVYDNTKKYEPIFIAAKNNNDIAGILLAVIQKEHSEFIGKFSSRSIIWGAPLVINNDINIIDLLLKEYNRKIKKKVIYSQFRNLFDFKEQKHIFIKNGYKYDDHLNIIVDISKNKENLWDEVNPKGRNKIRKAVKAGTIFSVESSEDALNQCYGILEEVYAKAKLPLPDYDFFFNLFNLGSRCNMILFCAKNNGKIIGCRLALIYKKRIYDFYAGSKKNFNNKYPNDLIPWEVFLWGKENGYKTFDFGGAGKPGVPYGVRDYKKKFGGEFMNFGRYQKIHKPFIYIFIKLGFKIWQLIKK